MATARAGDEWDGDVEEDDGTVSPLQGEEDFNKSCEKQMALLQLMDKTGYNMLQVNGQRMYGGPPPGWEGPPPPRDCEVFVGKIPRDMYEDELVPLLARAGKIYEFRLMMEFNGSNRGYAFIMYTNREDAHNAIQIFNNHEVRPGRFIGVCLSLNNCRLFIGCIPKDKAKEEIMEELRTVTDGVVDVIAYHRSTDQTTNRGFAFVEYETHKAAAMARRTLIAGNRQLWGHTIQVDWAKPERDMDDAIMQRVRVLYVCSLRPSTTEETLLQEFSSFKPGCVERVKKLSDYAFIHYRCREDAVTALGLMNSAVIDGVSVEVTLSRPAVIRDGRRYNSWGYPESRGGEALASSRMLLPPRSRRGTGDSPDGASPLRAPPLPTHPGSPACAAARDDPDRCVLPLLPSTPLCPGSLQVLEPGQIRSAVSLLDFYCSKNYWSQPQYQLFTTARWDGKLLLLYKVVIPCTQSTYVPDKLCALLEDAKELAAQTALWNLDPSFLSEVSYNSPGSLSPPLGIPLSSSTMLTCNSRAFASCISPPAPPPSPSPFSHSALSLSMLAPPDPQTQRVYLSSESPFY